MIRSRSVKKAYGIIYGVMMFIYIILMFRGQIIERRIENEFDFFNLEKFYESTGQVYKDEISRLKEDALKRYSLGKLEYIYADATVDMFKNEVDTYTVFRGNDEKIYHVLINSQLTVELKLESFIGKINETTGIIRESDMGAEFKYDSVHRRFEEQKSKNAWGLFVSLVVVIVLGYVQGKFFSIEKDELDEYELQKIIDKWEEIQENGKRMYIARTFVFMVLQVAIPPILLHGTDFDMQHIIGMSFLYFFIVILYTWVSAGVGLEKKEKAYWEAKEMLESMKSKDKRNKSKEEIV